MEASLDSFDISFNNKVTGTNKYIRPGDYSRGKNDENHLSYVVEQSFSKRFSFEKDEEQWKLPVETNIDHIDGTYKTPHQRWQISELEELKIKLNHVKGKLNSYNFGDWHKHTRSRNPASLIMRDLRNFEIELLTQAWCKFFELINVYKIVPLGLKSTFKTFHLCEAPGAFVCSLNHYLKLNHPSLEWRWFASTLNPYHESNSLDEMINDDRFISRTLKNWWFGIDNTGNLRHKCNLEDLKQFTSAIGPIHLVTADGSIDCCKNPGDQETYVLPLHYSEAISALSILSPGGNFVMKIFTVYECETVCLLYLLCCVFKYVTLHKPVVSKEGNSEVYVVCLEYSGKETCQSILDNADYYGSFPTVLFKKEDLSISFIEQIIKSSTFFTNTQISVLERNIRTYQHELTRKKRTLLWKIKTKVAERFIQSFNLYPLIDPSEYILKGLYLSNPLQLDPKNEDGTFEERVESQHTDTNSILLNCRRILESLQVAWDRPFIYWIRDWNKEGNVNKISELSILKSSPITSIRSSKFCKGSLLKVVHDLQDFGIFNTLLNQNHKSLNRLNEELTNLESEHIVCSVENQFWLSDFHRAQRECLKCLILSLKNIKLNTTLVLIGLPLLTQFNLGLIYLLSLSFSEVGITTPEVGYVAIFKNLLNFDFYPKLSKIHDLLLDSESGILSIVPISHFLEGECYSCFTTCNHLIIKNVALEVIDKNLMEICRSETNDK